ncbi:MAG: WYL domain-containing transcriptional regulator [Dehalococcoidia bacterium]|nr:WYL domain-containing transcriptional regulator [Dehalococcoidia bacterium]
METCIEQKVMRRWRELARLLHERHWTQAELADYFDVTTRTIQRDFACFAVELREPVPREKGRFYLKPGMHPVPTVDLTHGEARTLLFAMRLLLRGSTEQDRDAATLIEKLATVFPGPISQQVAITRAEMAARPVDAARQGMLARLTNAWIQGQLVTMAYRAVDRRSRRGFCFEPWVLEPSRGSGEAYVVGYDHSEGKVGTYKLARVGSVEAHPAVCPMTRQVHPPVSREEAEPLMAHLGRSWSGIVLGKNPCRAVVDFAGDAAIRVREGSWHATRTFEELEGGRVRMTIDLDETFDFAPWVLSWGKDAVVVEPPELRARVAEELAAGAAAYGAQALAGSGSAGDGAAAAS